MTFTEVKKAFNHYPRESFEVLLWDYCLDRLYPSAEAYLADKNADQRIDSLYETYLATIEKEWSKVPEDRYEVINSMTLEVMANWYNYNDALSCHYRLADQGMSTWIWDTADEEVV